MKTYANRFVLAVFLAGILILPILSVVLRSADILYYENRPKAAAPQFTWESALDGQYFTSIDTALSDRIFFRDRMIQTNTSLDLLARRPVVNNYVISTNALVNFHGYLTWGTEHLPQVANDVVGGIARIQDTIQSYGGQFFYVGLPQQYTYFASVYPNYMDDRLWNTEAIRNAFSQAMASRHIPFIDMNAEYRALGQPADYYFFTDHHFSYQGAFLTSQIFMQQVRQQTGYDIPVLSAEDIDFITLPNPFLGSRDRALYDTWKKEEFLEIGIPKQPIQFTRYDNGNPTASSVYDLPLSVTERISYSIYMGGDVGETIILTERPELPKLLIIGESFTNALETLLWVGFDETRSLDYRYNDTDESLEEYILHYKPDVVLCVKDEGTYLDRASNAYFYKQQ